MLLWILSEFLLFFWKSRPNSSTPSGASGFDPRGGPPKRDSGQPPQEIPFLNPKHAEEYARIQREKQQQAAAKSGPQPATGQPPGMPQGQQPGGFVGQQSVGSQGAQRPSQTSETIYKRNEAPSQSTTAATNQAGAGRSEGSSIAGTTSTTNTTSRKKTPGIPGVGTSFVLYFTCCNTILCCSNSYIVLFDILMPIGYMAKMLSFLHCFSFHLASFFFTSHVIKILWLISYNTFKRQEKNSFQA